MRLRSLLPAALLAAATGLGAASDARADKLRDLVEISGARDNQLVGYGVVTGLNGTGDDVSAPLAAQSMLSMLRRLGVQSSSQQLRLRNVAAVMVTATIPPFAKPGTKIDITVSSIGNARSIRGGVLIQTLLKGADRKTYAVAQGNLVIGGFSAKGRSGSSAQNNITTSGRIPEGAIVEREIETTFTEKGNVDLSLRTPSFTMASRISEAIDAELGEGSAYAVDGGTVRVKVPKKNRTNPVGLIAKLQNIDVTPDRKARVVISERTQTIVAGGDVRLSPVAVVHGGLTIVVKETPKVSQPVAPFGTTGTTEVVPETQVEIEEKESTMQYLDGAATLSDLAGVLGTLGLNARELISVLQALRTAGALEAEVVVQ
ncbi:MAG TPA: flagellar basal body P-ring protein FlgI [Polyangiaceae bacterium]|nr:flagellar basal body P-ring protein FlgI [Polyangiaceae bacterium]